MLNFDELEIKVLYYAFGRNDSNVGAYVDPHQFRTAFMDYAEKSNHIPNVQTAFNRFRDGLRIGES